MSTWTTVTVYSPPVPRAPLQTMFYVWVTLVDKNGVDKLIAGLVRKGFKVEPLDKNDNLTQEGDYAVLCAMNLSHDKVPDKVPDKGEVKGAAIEPPHWCSAFVRKILRESKTSWHSVVVFHLGGSCTWSGPTYFTEDPPRFPKSSASSQLDNVSKAIGEDP